MNLRQYAKKRNDDNVTIPQVVAAIIISTSVIVLFHLGALLCQ